MPTRRSSKQLPAAQVRRFKREAERIDREEVGTIRAKGRAVKQRHDRLRDAIRLLRSERVRLGLSLAEVGERSGIGKANLSRLENDPDPNPTLDTIMRYAEAIGREIRIVLDGPDGGHRRAS